MSDRKPPKPTFVTIEEDGCVNIEWSFDTWRLAFVCDPDEGVMVCETRDAGAQQNFWEGVSAVRELARLLGTGTVTP